MHREISGIGSAARRMVLLGSMLVVGGGIAAGPAAIGVAHAAGCVAAGSTGLTAAKVVTSNHTIGGVINAAGCDIGVYVGPGSHNVAVSHATITDANDHAVLIQDSSFVYVSNNTITFNGTPANHAGSGWGQIAEDK